MATSTDGVNLGFDMSPEDAPAEPAPESKSSGYGSPRPRRSTKPDMEPTPLSVPDKSAKLNDNYDKEKAEEDHIPQRPQWSNQIEFLMSCISTSVGLGNVWRFPFAAYENGGGAFLIPYIIVLFLVGKPMYYLECLLGQFSSRNSVRYWALSPAMKGTGYAQTLSCCYILSYYVVIVALCLYYLVMSFQSTLPWTICNPEWGDGCVSSAPLETGSVVAVPENASSSAELYFIRTVLQQSEGLETGLGLPIWYLTVSLLAAWIIIFLIVSQGVKSSGKAAYFLAIFPYVVMIILLITTVLLPGADKGILFFITPQWDKLLDLTVWYAAVTQVFFSLSVCTGTLIMFSSYNGFRQNIYRDAMIVTTLDTFTSLLSGITIFGILGNLAYELDSEVEDVVGAGGTGLAFISYPDAISKTFMPQLFSVLFFLMMSVLGVGSSVALLSTINTVLLDSFPKIRTVFVSAFSCTIGFGIGLFYVTPSGQYILELVDHYGGTFLVLFTAIAEIIGVFYIYGLENLCLDVEFMLGIRTSIYWRICWSIVTPFMMMVVFAYTLVSFEAPIFGEDYHYPAPAVAFGYIMLFAGVALVPIFMVVTFYRRRNDGNCKKIVVSSFLPKSTWGPRAAADKREWLAFKAEAKEERQKLNTSRLKHMWMTITGGYRKNK